MLLYISLALNYLFIAFGVLAAICGDERLSADSVAFVSLAWPLGVPMMLLAKVVHRGRS